MKRELILAKILWDRAVGAEASKLIRSGVPASEAVEQARANVSIARRQEVIDKG